MWKTLESGFGKYLFSKLEHVWTPIHTDAVAIQTLKCWWILFEQLLFYVETLYQYLDRYVLRKTGADMPMDLTQFPLCGYFDVWERSRQAAWCWTHFCKYMFNIARSHTHTHTHTHTRTHTHARTHTHTHTPHTHTPHTHTHKHTRSHTHRLEKE